jgi:hypothetical protein
MLYGFGRNLPVIRKMDSLFGNSGEPYVMYFKFAILRGNPCQWSNTLISAAIESGGLTTNISINSCSRNFHYLSQSVMTTYLSWLKFSVILGTFTELRKATKSFVMPVCPFVRIQQLGSYWKDFHTVWHLGVLRKVVEAISLIKLWQKQQVLYIKIYVHLWYLAEFFVMF